MKGTNPRRPSGSDAESVFHQATHDKLTGPEFQLRDSATVKWSRTSRGLFAHVRPGAGSVAGPGLAFKGEWPGTGHPCKANEIWIISGDTNTGTYVCLEDTTSDPWAGAPGWAMFPTGGLGPWV
jgi:hypothetical protein